MAVSAAGMDWENLTPVRVSHLIDPSSFWLVPLDDVKLGEELEKSLTEYFRDGSKNDGLTGEVPSAGEFVAVLHPMHGKWMRAEVQQPGEPSSLLFLLDHGMAVNMATRNTRPLPPGFCSKFHALRLHLRGVQPLSDGKNRGWSAAAYSRVASLLFAADGCYLNTAANEVDIADPVVFGTLFACANGQLVDVGADLEMRGFATRSLLNAAAALETFKIEPLCLGPNVSDPRQVSNPMHSCTVQSQIAYEAAAFEQRRAAPAVGRGGKKSQLMALVEQRPIQYMPGGHNVSRLPECRPSVKPVAGRAPGAISPSLNASEASQRVRSPDSQPNIPMRNGSTEVVAKGDSSFNSANSPPGGSRDTSTSSQGSELRRGRPSRSECLERINAQLALNLNTSDSVAGGDSLDSSDSRFLAANDSVSSTDSQVWLSAVVPVSAPVPARSGRCQQLVNIAQADKPQQPPLVSAAEVIQPARGKRWQLMDKFLEESAEESDSPASESQLSDSEPARQSESLVSVSQRCATPLDFDSPASASQRGGGGGDSVNLSLMNVSDISLATPMKKLSRGEHLKMLAARNFGSTPVPSEVTQGGGADVDSSLGAGVQDAKSVPTLSVAVSETLHESPRPSKEEAASQLPAALRTSAGSKGNSAPQQIKTTAPETPAFPVADQPTPPAPAGPEPPKSQMPMYRRRLSPPRATPEVSPAPTPRDQAEASPTPTPQARIAQLLAEDTKALTSQAARTPPTRPAETPPAETRQGGRMETARQQRRLDGARPARQGRVAETLAMNRVLVHGRAVEQVLDMRSAPFPGVVHSALQSLHVLEPTRLQQVAWPAIVRGDDAVVVSQRTGGMTLAYLAPLAALLLQPAKYQELRASCPGLLNGPIAVVLCPGFEQCTKIERMCEPLLRAHGVKVVVAHGGGAEQEKEIELLNGCDLLITTPLCFYRLLAFRKLIVNLRRICHLVLSNAGKLVEKFKKQLVIIMESCRESVRRRLEKGRSSNGLQVVATSNIWSLEIYAMVHAVAPRPLVVIGSYLEAAIYAEVQPKLDILPAVTKMSRVLEILSEERGLHKSVVVCQNSEKVEAIVDMLVKNKFYVLEVHEKLLGPKRNDVRKEWAAASSQRPVLVMSDLVLEDMLIDDAVVLVQFDMPSSKNGFGRRFSLMMENYPSIHTSDKFTKRDCRAHVLVDEANSEQLPGIVDFMRRLGATIVPKLEAAAKMARVDRERCKTHLPICPNVKAFGECHLEWSVCPNRHALLPTDESLHLPKCGRVKLHLLQVLDACRFSVHLLELSDADGRHVGLAHELTRLSMEMALYFASSANRAATGAAVVVEDVVAVETTPALYQRGRVVGVTKRDAFGQTAAVKLWMVDLGEWRESDVARLVSLPAALSQLPPLAAEVILCRAAPTDGDTAWSPAAHAQICRWVNDTERDKEAGCYFVGDIALSLGNTLWLDPLQARRRLAISDADIVVRSFRHDLVERQLAVDRPDHLAALYEMCEDAGIDVECYRLRQPLPGPRHASPSVKETRAAAKPRWQHLRDCNEYTVSFVSAVSPGCLFVRLAQFERQLAHLNTDIRRHLELRDAEPRRFLGDNLVIAAGAICLAKYQVDGNWHRAQVCGVSEDGSSVEVFFVDHGDRSAVDPSKELVPITDRLVEYLPFMAIQCSLAGILPVDETSWLNGATDLLYDLTVNEADMAKLLDYRIVQRTESDASPSGVTYSVVLVDATATDDSVLNRVLVERGLAAYDPDTRAALDETPRIVELPPTPPPSPSAEDWGRDDDDSGGGGGSRENIELKRSTMPGKVAQDSVPELIRLEDLKNKPVSLVHPEDLKLEEGESAFDFEIDDVRSFVFRMIHGRADDAEEKLRILNSMGESGGTGPQPSPAIVELDSDPSPASAAAAKPPSPPPPTSPAPVAAETQVYTGVPGAVTPRVVWYQELRTVHLSIELVDVGAYVLDSAPMSVDFSTTGGDGGKFALALELFGAVHPQRTEHANTGRRISITLHKIYAGNWPQLLECGDRGLHWLRYDVDHASTASERTVMGMFDTDPEIDEAEMHAHVRRAKERAADAPVKSTLPDDWRGQVVPHFQYEESDDDDDDGSYIPPDKPYRFEDRNDPLY